MIWAEKEGDITYIYCRYFYPGGYPFWYFSLYSTSAPIDPHPTIETNSGNPGAKTIYVFEGSDGLYFGYTEDDYIWSYPQKIPNTNVNSKFPSLQMRAYPWRMVYEENQKIYTMTFDWATKQWSARSQIASSGHHPNICGEYTSYPYYWVSYDCSSMPPTWTVKVYRSKTGTYYSFTNWLKWYYYPAIRSDEYYQYPNITLTFEEWYNHDVYYTLFNSSTGTWGPLNLISNDGEKPNIAINYNQVSSDIIWTSDSEAPYRIKTYPEQRGEMLIENQLFSYNYSREIQFDLSQYPLIKNKSLNLSGEISVKILPYMFNQDTIPFIILTDSASANNFFTSNPFLVNNDSLLVCMTITAKNLQIPSKLVNGDDINLFQLDLKLNEKDKYLSTLYNLTMNGLTSLGQDSFVVNKTIHTNLSAYTNRIVKIEEKYLKRSPNFKPIFIENYEIVSNDSIQSQTEFLSQKENTSETIGHVSLNEYKLYTNYPNPFNPSTTISFDLPKDINVRVEIFDINGRKIHTLVDEPKEAGTHQVVWNGQDDHSNSVASGLYVYRIQAGDFVQSKKLLFMK